MPPEPIHAGLVILIPNVDRAEQRRLFRGALDELIRHGDLVNQVLEVDIDGDEATFTNYELPPSSG